jgi:predicted phage-related endonuclease
MAMAVEQHEIVDREQWLAWRQPYANASTIAAIFGMHPFVSPLRLFLEKSGLAEPPEPSSTVINRGRRLEAAVAEWVREERPGWSIKKSNLFLYDKTWRLSATPDYVFSDEAGRPGVLQIKTTAKKEFEKHWTPEAPPLWVSLQTLTEMMLSDAEIGAIAVMVVDAYSLELFIYDVPRDASAEQRIVAGTEKFWSDVAAGTPPQIDYERDGPLIALLFPTEVPGKEIDLRADNRLPGLLDRREQITAVEKTIEAEKTAIDVELKAKIGEAEVALLNGWRVSLKRQERREYTVKATSFRRLWITKLPDVYDHLKEDDDENQHPQTVRESDAHSTL